MAPDDRKFLLGVRVVTQWADELVGYEPTTHPLNPDDPDECAQFCRAWNDAAVAGAAVLAVIDPENRITIWKATCTFWML